MVALLFLLFLVHDAILSFQTCRTCTGPLFPHRRILDFEYNQPKRRRFCSSSSIEFLQSLQLIRFVDVPHLIDRLKENSMDPFPFGPHHYGLIGHNEKRYHLHPFHLGFHNCLIYDACLLHDDPTHAAQKYLYLFRERLVLRNIADDTNRCWT